MLSKKLVCVVLFATVGIATSAITAVAVFFQSAATAQTFFSCTDEQGRQIRSDRPIAECVDRNQNELSSTGMVRKIRGPTLTVLERNALDEKEKIVADALARTNEEKRINKALLLRYPNRAVHDNERGLALASLNDKNQAVHQKIVTLTAQRQKIDNEFEFYAKDKSKAPIALKRQLESVDAGFVLQNRYLLDLEMERNRINVRFDLELTKLMPLWSQAGSGSGQQSEKK